jgi:hypothetical protein
VIRFGVALREGVRFVDASRVRSLVVASSIAVATMFAMWSDEVAAAAMPFAFVVLAVARRSPRPERLAQMRAWQRVGTARLLSWSAATVEAVMLGWGGALVGACLGLAPVVLRSDPIRWRWGYLPALLGVLAIAACLPTRREAKSKRLRRTRTSASVVLGAALAAGAITGAFMIATLRIDDSLSLSIAGLCVVALLTTASLLLSGLASERIVRVLAHVGRVTPLSAIAERRKTPMTVRLVIAVAIVLVAATSILGASVGARPETERELDARLARLPVLPPNVALLSAGLPLESYLYFRPVPSTTSTGVTPIVQRAARNAVPGARIIPIYRVDELGCALVCENPHIVADPRLREVYGQEPTFSLYETIQGGVGGGMNVSATTRVPPYEELQRRVRDNRPLPRYSFAGAAYSEISLADAASLGPPFVESVFVLAPRTLSSADLRQLGEVAQHAQATLIGPKGQTSRYAERPSFGGDHSLRKQPWATTDASTRWSIAAAAAAAALAALFITLVIDTLDRRQEVERLERLGATGPQVRGATALRAGALFFVITLSTVTITALLVRVGVHAYTERQPETPIPFVMPWTIVAFLVVGLPVLAAALAALVARPLRMSTIT